LFSFALAMGATTLVAKWQITPPSRWVCRLLPAVTSLLLLAGVLTRHRLGVAHSISGLCWSFGFVGVILWCSARQDWLTRILQFRPLTALAMMSYSVFLVHAHILEHIVGPWYASVKAPPSPLLVLPFAIAAMVIASWLFYRVVEKPLSNYFYRLRTQAGKNSRERAEVATVSSP
jgi:peptidoglycan/LPS O-acetylase OafA/YrhL